MLRLPALALVLFFGFASLGVAASSAEPNYAGMLRQIRASRRALRHARRATASIIADPGVKIVTSQFAVCPPLQGFAHSGCGSGSDEKC